MTVLATEAAGTVRARAGAKRAARHRRPPASRVQRVRQQASAKTADTVREAPARYGRQAAYVGQRAQVTPGGRGYQPVLLAEFLAAVVIVALVPVAAGGSASAKMKDSVSPYDAGDLVQLVAVGGVYFVLALASSGNSGRLSAWLGGLVLLGLTMAKLSHGQLGEVFATVSGQRQQEEKGSPQA